MKRRLGLGKLRVRGRKAVFHAIYLKAAGWNLLRAAASGRLATVAQAVLGAARCLWRLWTACVTKIRNRERIDSFDERSCNMLIGIH